MADRKTATLMLRLDSAVEQSLRAIAEREHRSLANRVEMMIIDYSRQREVPISELLAAVEQTVPAPKLLFPHPDPSSSGRSL